MKRTLSQFKEENTISNNNSTDDSSSTSTNSTEEELKYKPKTLKRSAISWDDYFMSISFLSSLRSKDPSTQVGACIVNKEKKIVGIGYNGMPRGCSDDDFPWDREADSELDTKYPYVCHAELNAILNKNSSDVKDCSIYVALFPCNECAKVIIQSGICEVVYMSDKYATTNSMKASKRMLNSAKINLRQYIPTMKQLTINFSDIDMNQLEAKKIQEEEEESEIVKKKNIVDKDDE